MRIDDKHFDIVLNPPIIQDVKIAEPLMTDTNIYPFKLKVEFFIGHAGILFNFFLRIGVYSK